MSTSCRERPARPAWWSWPYRRLYAFWTTPIRAEPLALFRILLGAIVLGSALLSIGPHLDRYLGPDRLCPPGSTDDWVSRTGRLTLFRPASIPWLSARLSPAQKAAWAGWFEAPQNVRLLFVLWVTSLALLTAGYWTRAAAVAAWLLTISFNNRLSWLINGGDSLLECGLFYLMISPAGAVWSVDALRRPARVAADRLIPPWSVRLMQIQICFVYFFTGLVKLGPDWLNGEAVYWVLNDLALTRWPYSWLPVPLFLCRILSWATLVFEIGFPVLVLIRPVRPWLLLGGVLFHLGILLHTEVGWFSAVTSVWYVLFLSGESLRGFLARLGALLPGGSADSAEAAGPAASVSVFSAADGPGEGPAR